MHEKEERKKSISTENLTDNEGNRSITKKLHFTRGPDPHLMKALFHGRR